MKALILDPTPNLRNTSGKLLQNNTSVIRQIDHAGGADEPVPELAHLLKKQTALLQDLLQKLEAKEIGGQRIPFSNQEETVYVSLRDLIRIESRGNCCAVYALGNPNAICVSINIGKYIERLEHLPFLYRTHRRHFVNLHFIKKIVKKDGSRLVVQAHNGGSDVEIPVAQRYKEELLERLTELPDL